MTKLTNHNNTHHHNNDNNNDIELLHPGLPSDTTDVDLYEIFSPFGAIPFSGPYLYTYDVYIYIYIYIDRYNNSI